MYKCFKTSIVSILMLNPIQLVAGDGNPQPFEYLPPNQWKLPPEPHITPINLNSTEEKNNEPDVLPHVPDYVVADVLEHYPDIAEKIKILQDPQMQTKFLPNGLILVGQPGVSKTTIALAIAQQLNRKVAFFEATSLVGDRYQNSGVCALQEKLGKIVKELRQSKDTQYVVIVDEIMRLAEKYNNEKGEGKDISTKLWLLLDQFKDSKRVFFIATANSISKLPDQLRSRFSDEIMEIGAPDAAYRKKILLNHLENYGDLSDAQLEAVVKQTDGLTHRDLTNIVMHAGRRAVIKNAKNPKITHAELVEAYKKNRECNQKSYKEQFVAWADDNKELLDGAQKVVTIAGGVIFISAAGYCVVVTTGPYGVLLVKKIAIAASLL